MSNAAPLPWLKKTTINRIVFLVRRIEDLYGNGVFTDVGTLAERVSEYVLREHGIRTPPARDGIASWIEHNTDPAYVTQFIMWASQILREAPRLAAPYAGVEHELNRIFEQEHVPVRLRDGEFIAPGESEADELLRQVLSDRSEMAGCQRGDVQVEMVASSAQVKLGEGTTIIDYGAGLGRVGDGLSTAREFTFASYVAIDEPIHDDLRRLVDGFGERCTVMQREEYLAGPLLADVVLVVNTLHHIPFADIPRQFGRILRSLDKDGILVVHEMGTLDPPEQKNFPWTYQRILRLLECDGVTLSPRETKSRSKSVPLAHVIARVTGPLVSLEEQLADRAREVWHAMKDETLETIRGLYARGNPDELPALRRAMIHNANLDLNPPPAPKIAVAAAADGQPDGSIAR